MRYKFKENILANPKLAREILKEFDTANKKKGRIKTKNEIQYHKLSNTYSFGRYRYLTREEAIEKEKKFKSASSQLFKNEVLTHY